MDAGMRLMGCGRPPADLSWLRKYHTPAQDYTRNSTASVGRKPLVYLPIRASARCTVVHQHTSNKYSGTDKLTPEWAEWGENHCGSPAIAAGIKAKLLTFLEHLPIIHSINRYGWQRRAQILR